MARRTQAAAAFVSIGLASMPAHADGGALRFRVVALQGGHAPGTAAGVDFARFSTPVDNSSPRPAIDADGNHAIFALLQGSGVIFGNMQGIWSESNGVLTLLARGGDPAPFTGELFAEFPILEVPGEPIIRAGRTAFSATLTGGANLLDTLSIFSDRGGTCAPVVRTGDAAPGIPGATFGGPFLRGFNTPGHVLIAVTLNGVSPDTDESLWTDRSGAFALVAREGQAAPGAPAGVVFGVGQIGAGPSVLPEAVFNDASRVAFQATLAGPGITSHNDEALYLEDAQGAHQLAREGQPAPGAGGGVTFGGNSVQLLARIHSLTADGRIAFSARLGGSIPTTDAIFSSHTGVLTQVVRQGQPAPGTGGTFAVIGGARLSESGRLVFTGSTATGFFPPLGIWRHENGAIEPVLLPGAAVGAATVTGAGSIAGYAASGLLAVSAGLNHPQVGPQTALLLIEPDGNIHKLAASGELFDATGQGDFRTVSIITPGGLAESGDLAFRIRFTDGTEGSYAAGLDGCYPDCTHDGALTVADFGCFQTQFVLGDPYADCNADGALTVSDFGCFQTKFVQGCP